MPKQRIEPVRLDVQQVIDMLERDKCPASVGCFDYPNREMGLMMVLAQPQYAEQIQAFIKTLYAEAGYVSPTYDANGKEVASA